MTQSVSTRSWTRSGIFHALLILILALLDQLLKHLARTYLAGKAPLVMIPGFIQLTYQENPGISFSLFSDLPDAIRIPLLAGLSLVVILGMAVYAFLYWKKMGNFEQWGFSLILAGAIGNLIDRVFRNQVTDYMHFHFFETSFFVNNFADDLISIGFVLVLLHALILQPKISDETKEPEINP